MNAERLRILVAEDEALIRMDLREMLEEEGHEVVAEVSDGAAAVEAADDLRPDLVFMDVMMPGVDGITAAREIFERRLAPVVMVTAFSQAELVSEASEAGAMAYLVKPFAKHDLLPAMMIARARFAEARMLEGEVVGLNEQLETRKVVERAKGLLAEKGGLTEAEAFARLRKLAMDRRLTLREVADAILLADGAEG